VPVLWLCQQSGRPSAWRRCCTPPKQLPSTRPPPQSWSLEWTYGHSRGIGTQQVVNHVQRYRSDPAGVWAPAAVPTVYLPSDGLQPKRGPTKIDPETSWIQHDSDRYTAAAAQVEPDLVDLGSSMSKSGRLQTFTVPWRRTCAAIPSVALIGGRIAISAPPQAHNINGVALSSHSPAIVVPDLPLSLPAPAGIPKEASRLAAEVAPAPALAGPTPSSSVVNPDISDPRSRPRGLPASSLPGRLCRPRLPTSTGRWWLPLARSRATMPGSAATSWTRPTVAQSGIIAIPLDGSNGTAPITDSDGGLLDRDSVYDRAVGPMQFIRGTWRVAVVDADAEASRTRRTLPMPRRQPPSTSARGPETSLSRATCTPRSCATTLRSPRSRW